MRGQRGIYTHAETLCADLIHLAAARTPTMRSLVALVAFWPLAAFGAAQVSVENLETRAGVTIDLLIVTPKKPHAVAVLFAGGRGLVVIEGGTTTNQNFLVRSREEFARHGLIAVVVGPPSDRLFPAPDGSGPVGLGFGFRRFSEHAADIAAIIRRMRVLAPNLPVWLVGASRGSTSAAYGAMRLDGVLGAEPDGIVLTSSLVVPVPPQVTPTDDDSLLLVGIAPDSAGLSLSQIRVPVLIMHHVNDQCFVTPYAGVEALQQQLTGTVKLKALAIHGGAQPTGDPCDALHFHGFIGIENSVVARIAHWIKHAE
jgi:hypothetical protein